MCVKLLCALALELRLWNIDHGGDGKPAKGNIETSTTHSKIWLRRHTRYMHSLEKAALMEFWLDQALVEGDTMLS